MHEVGREIESLCSRCRILLLGYLFVVAHYCRDTVYFGCLCCGMCSLWFGATFVFLCVRSEALSYPIPRDLKHLESLRLRYFSPREVSLLLGFPRDLEFPASLTPRQMYALLGNSLSVTVVAQLLTHLLRGAGVDVAPQDLNK